MTPGDDWLIPDSWMSERDNQRRVARELRAEADMFRDRYYERRSEGAPRDELKALEYSRWSAIEKAAEIERAIRDIG